MLAVLFICVCSGTSEAEVQSEALLQETQTAATIVTIEVEEEEDSVTSPIPEAGSFEYYCYIIEQAAYELGVSAPLAVAISRLETGNFTSDAFLHANNFGGLTGSEGLMCFESEQAGLEAYMKCLAWYHSQGMTTPEKMNSVYCPSNLSWAAQVEEIMEEHT